LSPNPAESPPDKSLRQLVAGFARAKPRSAWWQLSTTAAAFLATWGLMAASLDWGYGWTLALAPLAAGLYIRLFVIQHDCGHGSFFAKRWLDHPVGAALGLITLVPYGYWKKTHAVHHATSGNLDRREFGDVRTLTVAEYRARSPLGRFGYRLYRSAPVLFIFGPIYQFVLKHRFPFDLPFAWKKEWASVLWNNLALALAAWALGATLGWWTLLLVHGPIMVIAGAAGVWLFYVQHQFEEAYWEQQENWDFEAAALAGSSFYDLPRVLHWFTGNIGYHHIHHLSSKVPNYRLRECYESSPLLQRAPRLSIRASLRCARLKLWDPEARKLVGFPSRRTLEA
jgi:omega-6 fatty acid desaturase (delta-12 desaturase)